MCVPFFFTFPLDEFVISGARYAKMAAIAFVAVRAFASFAIDAQHFPKKLQSSLVPSANYALAIMRKKGRPTL